MIVCACMFSALGGVVVGGIVAYYATSVDFKRDAVRLGHAYYAVDKTGKAVWRWRVNSD